MIPGAFNEHGEVECIVIRQGGKFDGCAGNIGEMQLVGLVEIPQRCIPDAIVFETIRAAIGGDQRGAGLIQAKRTPCGRAGSLVARIPQNFLAGAAGMGIVVVVAHTQAQAGAVTRRYSQRIKRNGHLDRETVARHIYRMLQTLDLGIGPGTSGAALDLDFAVVLNVNVVIIDFIVFLCFAVVGVQKNLNTIVFVDVVGGEIRHYVGILNAKAKIQIVVIPGRLELALVVADGEVGQVFDAVGRYLLPDTLIELAVHRDRSAGFPALCQVGRRGRLLRGQ